MQLSRAFKWLNLNCEFSVQLIVWANTHTQNNVRVTGSIWKSQLSRNGTQCTCCRSPSTQSHRASTPIFSQQTCTHFFVLLFRMQSMKAFWLQKKHVLDRSLRMLMKLRRILVGEGGWHVTPKRGFDRIQWAQVVVLLFQTHVAVLRASRGTGFVVYEPKNLTLTTL